MLRRVDDGRLTFRKKRFSKSRYVILWAPGIRGEEVGLLSKEQCENLLAWQKTYPQSLMTVKGRTYWHFQDRFYSENNGLTADQVQALLLTRQQREQRRIDRAQAIVSMGLQPQEQAHRRDMIPDDVKQLVWMRDGGRCRNCGAQTELQFDHVIPVAMGGSSDPANLQILCGPCNRRKSAGLTMR